MTEWKRLGAWPPERLVDARLQLHWAAQIVASVGYTFVEPVADYSHTSLSWLPDPGVLAGKEAPGPASLRVALSPSDMNLHLLDEEAQTVSRFGLAGNTLEEGYGWLQRAVADRWNLSELPSLTRPDHAMPAHPVGNGARFAPDQALAFEEMSRWFSNAHHLLQMVHETNAMASPVRCWPHHFDIAVLLTYDPDKDAEEARSIGVGLSPGDGSYAEPYWYVSPWPRPKASDLPPLPAPGSWHTEGWVGAVLPARLLDAGQTSSAQAAQAQAFIQTALEQLGLVLGLQ